jgi:hypothetical protein
VKRIFFVLILVLMLSMAAVVPYASASPDDYHRRRTPTPRPRPTATSASVTLTAPTLLSPANGETRHTGNLIFTWSPVPGAARYHIQAGGIIENWSLTEPSYTFNVTSGFVTYFPRLYWRVQAIDANHVQGPWSEWSVIHLVSP